MFKPLSTIYEMVSKACCVITVYLDGEQIGEGTGFAIGDNGAVVTAAHVVTCRMPIRESDYRDPSVKIFAKFVNIPPIEYCVAVCGINITCSVLTEDVQLDQAILYPVNSFSLPFPHLLIGPPPKLGDEVYFAGYSDELELPFTYDRKLNSTASEYHLAMQQGGRAAMLRPMIKRGVVGNIMIVETHEPVINEKLQCDVFYIDNSIHSGASGGPVFNRGGIVIGVIVQRATTDASQTDAPKLRVPSGSTVCLGLQTIPSIFKWMAKQAENNPK